MKESKFSIDPELSFQRVSVITLFGISLAVSGSLYWLFVVAMLVQGLQGGMYSLFLATDLVLYLLLVATVYFYRESRTVFRYLLVISGLILVVGIYAYTVTLFF